MSNNTVITVVIDSEGADGMITVRGASLVVRDANGKAIFETAVAIEENAKSGKKVVVMPESAIGEIIAAFYDEDRILDALTDDLPEEEIEKVLKDNGEQAKAIVDIFKNVPYDLSEHDGNYCDPSQQTGRLYGRGGNGD